MVKILDCTLRDGGHQTNWNFESEFVEKYIDYCKNSHIDFIEIGYRNFYDRENKGEFFHCDKKLFKRFFDKKEIKNVGVMADVSRINLEDFKSANDDFIDFIRLACHPDKIPMTLDIATELHKKGYDTFIQLMEIPNLKESDYKILEKWDNKNIVHSLYIADSYSTAQPEDISKYVRKLNSLGYEKISFHAHNNINLAFENTISAIKSGVYSVDVSLNGLGGNLDSKILLNYIEKESPLIICA